MKFQRSKHWLAIIDTEGKPDTTFEGKDYPYGPGRLVGESIRDEYAPLILAAPDLLAACEAFEKSWAESGGVGGNVRDMIRAAIAKAEGRPCV